MRPGCHNVDSYEETKEDRDRMREALSSLIKASNTFLEDSLLCPDKFRIDVFEADAALHWKLIKHYVDKANLESNND